MNFVFKLLTKQGQRYKGFLILYLLLALVIAVASVITTRLTGDLGQAAIDVDSNVLLRFIVIISAVTLLRAIASAASASWRTSCAHGGARPEWRPGTG